MTSAVAILEELRSLGSPENVAGMAKYQSEGSREAAMKEADNRHALAEELWETGIHDGRAVAYLGDDPKPVNAE